MLKKILNSTMSPTVAILILCVVLTVIQAIENSILNLKSIQGLLLFLSGLARFLAFSSLLLVFLVLLSKQHFSKRIIKCYGIASLVFLALYLLKPFILQNEHLNPLYIKQEFLLLSTLLLSICSWVPFIHSSKLSFWKFNNIMFIKSIKSLVFSTSLFITANIFIYFLDKQFDSFHISSNYFDYLIITCFIGFGCVYLIQQIPKNLHTFSILSSYPKFYRFFSNYYLSPLTLLFLVAHCAYLIYCLINLQWPYVQVTVAVSITSTILFLLICQLEMFKNETAKFMRKCAPIIYWATLIICSIYLVVLIRELLQNPITEFWIFILVLLLWSISCCLYFIFSKEKDIRFFPMSFSALLLCFLLPIFAPFNIATKSHVNYFKKQLHELGMLNKNNSINFAEQIRVSPVNEKKLVNCIYFLDSHSSLHLLASLYPYPISKESLTSKRILLDLNLKSS